MNKQSRSNDGLPPSWLIIALQALPQVAETALAPALPDIARTWGLEPAETQWVMGVFFIGFAIGVLVWGRASDRWGRRPAVLSGLSMALPGTLLSLLATDYKVLLLGRFIQALGLATCSVTVQTMLRDRLKGDALTKYYIALGVVLAWSPAVGPPIGQMISDWDGYRLVILLIAALVLSLLFLAKSFLLETSADVGSNVPMSMVGLRMARDPVVVRAAILVAGLNALVFSFYSAGPFMVGYLPGLGFGWVGLGVAIVGSLGAALNRKLPTSIENHFRVRYGLLIILTGCSIQLLFVEATHRAGLLWAATALPVFFGFGLALPNVLGPALGQYQDCLGRAGAIFGCVYYSLLGVAIAGTTILSFDSPVPLSIFWLVIVALLFVAHGKKPFLAIKTTGATELEAGV